MWNRAVSTTTQKKNASNFCGTFTILYHFMASLQEQIMTGTDLSLLAEEMRKAQEILKKIMELKSGVIGDTRIAVQASVDSCLSTVSISHVVFPNKAWWLCPEDPSHERHKCISFSFTHFHLLSSLSKIILNPILKVVIMPCGLSSAFVQTASRLCCWTGSLSTLKHWLSHFLKAHMWTLVQNRRHFMYSRTSTNGHLSTTAIFSADSPYIDPCLNLFKTATSLQRRPLSSVPKVTVVERFNCTFENLDLML